MSARQRFAAAFAVCAVCAVGALFVVASVFAAGSSAAVSGVPGYSGRWELVLAASEVATGRKLPRGRVDWIQHEDVWLNVRSRSVRTSGDSVALDFRYRTDGDAINKLLGQDIRTSGRRANGALVFETTVKLPLIELKVHERWSLSEKADTLVMVRDSDSPLGKEHQRLVFRRSK